MPENINIRIDAKTVCMGVIIATEVEDVIDATRPKLARQFLPFNGAGLDALDTFRRDVRKGVRGACERNLKNL